MCVSKYKHLLDTCHYHRTFDAGFLILTAFPKASVLFPELIRAREILATAMTEYMHTGGYKTASGLVRMRYEYHHEKFGFSVEDIARGEIGNAFAVLGNTTPCALWLIFHIFSDDQVLEDVRREVSALVYEERRNGAEIVSSVDLAGIRTSCPILMSTFQETMRFRAVTLGSRAVLEDVNLGGRYLLKKGSMLIIPSRVQHRDAEAWGDNFGEFDHLRFTRKPDKKHKRPNRVAYRAFGGGHVLCPGRHFASTELMAFAALLVLQFDVIPVGGRWLEPVCDNTPAHAEFPILDRDIDVELHPRDLIRE